MIDEKVITEVKDRLVALYNPDAIYLFGSYAWGTPHKDSDLDLLIVIDEYTKDRLKTMSDGYRALQGLNIFKDILVYSKKEFEMCSADENSLCSEVFQKGKKLYGKA